MEPEKFCKLCDSKSDGSRRCIVEEFYPRKGYCPAAIIGGMNASVDCNSICLENKIVLLRNKPRLAQAILKASKERMGTFQRELSAFYSAPDYSL